MIADRAVSIDEVTSAARHWLGEERIRVYSWMVVAIFAVVYVVWLGLSLPEES